MAARPKLFPAPAVLLPVAVAAAVAVCAAHPDDPRPDPPGAESPGKYLPPDPVSVRLATRSAARDRVAREVIAGRITLPEVAAAFAWFDRLPPEATHPSARVLERWVGLPVGDPYTESELSALAVVVWVVTLVEYEHPDGTGELIARARGQFLADRA